MMRPAAIEGEKILPIAHYESIGWQLRESEESRIASMGDRGQGEGEEEGEIAVKGSAAKDPSAMFPAGKGCPDSRWDFLRPCGPANGNQ